ncbi:MAG: carotenoid oxygenase family protein [Phenylobacterium sp.]|uniref:carotenoid oxygenase family protein n=1 Tax=Phenylobacterium sp. TaxID=1871053 RepID=UPI001A487BDD|nr:carotenoid oxygenase family protein [Phenylobacterium sp.]MBL8773388.1 carotenoid oxygenase family protein [Phenylobacterium sp.]
MPTLVNRVPSTIRPDTDHPYMTGAWSPTFEEWDGADLTVIGEIPRDLDGVYLRNTENPVHEPIGLYHPFDGDGMIHAMSFRDGRAVYRNRFVRTKGFLAEAEAGEALWAGLAEHPSKSLRPGWGAQGGLKDSSSTDVVVHAGQVLSTFYQCGEGYRLDPATLETLGVEGWVPADGISAHPKVDEATGELLFFNYAKTAPFMHYGVVGPDNRLKHYVPIPLPGPRLPHDMAFTKNWSILNDLPLFWQEDLLPRGIHAARFHPDMPSRFALIPRYGQPDEIRWFEARPCYVLHWLNAWEEGDEVILDGYFQEDPAPPPLPGFGRMGQMMAYLDEHSMKPKLYRWRFNLRTGETKEGPLDDRILEFGTFDQRVAGVKNRYVYSTTAKPGWFLFTGIVKHDLDTGRSWSLAFGEGRYGSEAPFAPRVGGTAEDDGYLVSFITDMAENRSECVVVDAKDIEAGPVCRILLPHRISSGTHACWAGGERLASRPAPAG